MHDITLRPGIPAPSGFGAPKLEGGIRNSLNSNAHIPPHPPVLRSGVFADGREDQWLEYVPEGLPADSRPPLIISCHGGGVNGQFQFEETSWCYIAEREGAIAVFPYAGGETRSWLTEDGPAKPGERPSMLQVFTQSPDGRASENAHHILFLKGLIENMKARYHIDEGRVYMQGMSMGDIMTMMFARVCGSLLAGAASTAGPSPEVALFYEDGSVKGYQCPVPVYQARGELDSIVVAKREGQETTRQEVNAYNRDFWLKVNECEPFPRIAIRDVNNFAFYTGKKANVVYRDVKHREHGQTLDDAQWAWETLFQYTRRNPDGSITCTDTALSAKGDVDAAALCADCGYAYVNNRRVKLAVPAFLETVQTLDMAARTVRDYRQELYAPVSFLSQAFGVKVSLSADGRSAVIQVPGGDCAIAEASVGCLQNGFLRAMLMPAKLQDGVLCVAIRWFAENIFGKQVTTCDGAVYLSDHHAEMTKDMAYLLRSILSA